MSGAGSGAFNISVGAGTDDITGGSDDDTITILGTGQGDADKLDGSGGDDTLVLSTGTHTFSTDGNLANIETIINKIIFKLMEIRRRPPNPTVRVENLEYAVPHREAQALSLIHI